MKMSILAIALLSSAHLLPAGPILEESVSQNAPLDPDATISIRNDDGAIWIYGADTREAKIQAIKKAYSQERLDAIKIDIVTTPQSLAIETKYPPKPRWSLRDRSGTVDYVIVVPWTCTVARADLANGEVLIDGMREAPVHTRLSNGRMFVHNCFGDVHAEVKNGGLDIAFEWWEGRKFSVDAKIINGNAHALLPGEAIFHLLATSVNGGVVSDFLGEQDRQRGGVPKIDIVIPGEPHAEMRLQAINGSVQVAESKF
jgi:hypothetical protein